MKNAKRVFSAFLALVMVLGMVPVSAVAEEVETQPVTVVEETTQPETTPEEAVPEETTVPEMEEEATTAPETVPVETEAGETVPVETEAEETVPAETEAEEEIPQETSVEASEEAAEEMFEDEDAGTGLVSYIAITAETTVTYVGGKVQMTAQVYPEDAEDQTVIWTIAEGENIARINEKGVLTAMDIGTVAVMATSKDGNAESEAVQIEIVPYYLDIGFENAEFFAEMPAVTSGNTIEAYAIYKPSNLSDTGIQWSLAEGDALYASLEAKDNTVFITGKDVTEAHLITLIAETKDGFAAPVGVPLIVRPKAQGVVILNEDEEIVTGTTIKVDLNKLEDEDRYLILDAYVLPEAADQELIWASSKESVASFDQNWGEGGVKINLGRLSGVAQITATAKNNQKVVGKVTIQTERVIPDLKMEKGSVKELYAGQSASFKAVDPRDGEVLTSEQITWFLAEEEGGEELEFSPYAKITEAGKLTTYKNVAETVTIWIMGRVSDDGETGVVYHPVTIYPLTTKVEIVEYAGESEVFVLNGVTIPVDTTYGVGEILLDARVYPEDTKQEHAVTWKSSNEKIAKIDKELGELTWAGKNGTVTITATAVDGSKKSASMKLVFSKFVHGIEISPFADTIRSGSSVTLSAKTYPTDATKGGVEWYLVDSADSAYVSLSKSGKLTAKTVYDEHEVEFYAVSKDGYCYSEVCSVTIMPKKDGILILKSGEENVTKSTVTLNVDDTLDLAAYTLGDTASENVTWKSSNSKVASVENGSVTAIKAGTATITATATDGSKRTASITVKVVRMTEEVEITEKNDSHALASGKSMTLKATLTDAEGKTPSVKTVTWHLKGEGAYLATITSGGKLTAVKGYMGEAVTVTVVAVAKDGSGAFGEYEVEIHPLAQNLEIALDGEEVTNATVYHNVMDGDTLELSAGVFPAGAYEEVKWTSSNKKIAAIDEETGELKIGYDEKKEQYKTGTVTITATAKDGSGKKASFKLVLVKETDTLELESSYVIAGGKTLTLKPVQLAADGSAPTDKTLSWTMTGDIAWATLTQKGVLKTKAVTERKVVYITVKAEDGSEKETFCAVYIYPKTKDVEIWADGKNVTGKTVSMNPTKPVELSARNVGNNGYNAAQKWTWKSSNKKIVEIDEKTGAISVVYDEEKGAYKTGTVTITATAADGSGEKATIKLKIV